MLLQMVNFHEAPQHVEVEVRSLAGDPETMTVTTLNSTLSTAENSFEEPFLVSHRDPGSQLLCCKAVRACINCLFKSSQACSL